MTLDELNEADEMILRDSLQRCCGSHAWVERMIALRPFRDYSELLSSSESVWNSLAPTDWLEAFAHHPKIGAKSASQWSTEEQRGMETAGVPTAAAMAKLNAEYERKFGFIFIVCATGKSADEMLALITKRLQNDPETELHIAAAEQSKITALRLEKVLNT